MGDEVKITTKEWDTDAILNYNDVDAKKIIFLKFQYEYATRGVEVWILS